MTKTPLVLLALAALLLAVASPAEAHKTAYSPDGSIKIVWGFLNEPAVTMTKNGLDLRITDNATGYNIPDLQSHLHVELHYGDEHLEFESLTGQFGKPGYYTAVVTPTKAGLYTLHVSGEVNGTQLDMEIPAAHDIGALEDTYFPALASSEARIAALEEKVEALEAKVKAQATTPTGVTTQTKPAPGFEPVLMLGALAAVALALAFRRKA